MDIIILSPLIPVKTIICYANTYIFARSVVPTEIRGAFTHLPKRNRRNPQVGDHSTRQHTPWADFSLIAATSSQCTISLPNKPMSRC